MRSQRRLARPKSGAASPAQSFIENAFITDQTQKDAVNWLKDQLVTNNLWDKMYSVYPFVGATAHSHKFNLKDPRDLNEAFILIISDGSHNSSGFTLGSNRVYTNVNPSLVYQNTSSAHISAYSPSTPVNFAFSATQTSNQSLRLENTSINHWDGFGINGRVGIAKITTPAGLILGTRTNENYSAIFRQGIKSGSNSSSNATGTAPTVIINLYGPGLLISFASIGLGLTDSEAILFSTIIQNYNTMLSRQI